MGNDDSGFEKWEGVAWSPDAWTGEPAQEAAAEDEPPGTMEERTAEEFSQLKADFAARGKREQKRFELNIDSEYWVCLIFPSREHCTEFLQNSNLNKLGDKYMDGCQAAQALKVPMALPMPDFPKSKIDRTWAEFPSIEDLGF